MAHKFEDTALDDLVDMLLEPGTAVNSPSPGLQFGFARSVLEYELHRLTLHSTLPSVTSLLHDERADAIAAVASGRNDRATTNGLGYSMECRLLRNPGDRSAWFDIANRAGDWASTIGFGPKVAKSFKAGIVEMIDNIESHGKISQPAVLVIHRSEKVLEYVVADTGQGLLSSLRTCREYERLRDDFEAIELSILPGVSRFGRESGHGYGFRPVLAPLKVADCCVRLRSGHACLSLTGRGQHPDQGIFSDAAEYQGLVVGIVATPTH